MKIIKVLIICFCLMQLAVTILGQDTKSISPESALKARQVLESGINAMGGIDALQALQDVTREMNGTLLNPGQGVNPASPLKTSSYKVTSLRDLRGQRAIEDIDAILGKQPLKSHFVMGSNMVFTANPVRRTIVTPPPPVAISAKNTAFRRYPETLLLRAWGRPETLGWVGEEEYEGRNQRVISFEDTGGTKLTLYFDAKTNLLTKSQVAVDNPVHGDTVAEIIYSDWRPVNKVKLPFRYIDKTGGSMTQELLASSIKLDTNPSDTLFTPPEGFSKPDGPLPQSPTPTLKKLAEDVYAVLGNYNSIFVVFKDYVLVLEAGFNNRYSQAAIAEIKKMVPDKPIRYLISTHFHYDHLGGVRSYIAEGTTIVTTPNSKATIEKIASATHLANPDLLAGKPQPPRIETFKGRRVFADDTHKVELYEFANPHCDEIIIAYLPKEKILFEADLFDLSVPEGKVPDVSDDTLSFAEQIQKLGLQVEHIVPVHGRIGNMDDLRRTLAGNKQ
jgi:glyoxylase-like metal-dependent hydrolase (beta-lactamase superfamily II)